MIHWALIAMICRGAAIAPMPAVYFDAQDMCRAAEAKAVSDAASGGYEVLTHQCALVSARDR